MNCFVLIILSFVLKDLVFVQAQVVSGGGKVTICTKTEDLICPTKSAKIHCKSSRIYRYQCPRACGLCVDKPAVPKHLVTVEKAREAMTEVVQDLISSISVTSNSTLKKKNVNQVNEVMYQIERSIGQADLSRKKYKLPELKSDIKEAVKLGNMKFARRTLGIALNAIGKSSSKTSGRRKRSTKLDAKKFLANLKKELGEKLFSKLFALEGGKTLMFAIDITGSMHDEIDAAKAIATNISTYKRLSPPSGYILSWFSDPIDLGGVIYKDSDQVKEFINEINNLNPDAGGDCPEYAYEGMFAALQEDYVYGSPLFVFTDASPKDATEDNVDMLLSLAEENGVTITFFTAEFCQDPPHSTFEHYKKLTSETGGNYLHVKDTKLKSLAKFTDTSLGSLTTVKAGGTKVKKRRKRSTIDEISIPVDNTISQLVVPVTAGSSATGITLETPSGLAWTKETDGLDNVAIYIVDSPSEGTWKLNVPASAGDYQYTVKASSDENIKFHFRYQKKVNRKTLELKFPLAGELADVDLTIAGAKQIKKDSIRVDIVDISGKVLIPDIKPKRNDENGIRYALSFKPPSEQFKMMIKGRTTKDKVFQRVSEHASQVKPLVLKEFYNSGRYSIKQGGSASIMLYLFNGMDTDQAFTVTFRDTFGYKISLLGSRRTKVRRKGKKFLRVSVRYGGGKFGKLGKTENVIILVKGSHGTSATEIVPMMIKEMKT